MNFSEALIEIKNGKKVFRKSWRVIPRVSIGIQDDSGVLVQHHPKQGALPVDLSGDAILAQDWEIMDDAKEKTLDIEEFKLNKVGDSICLKYKSTTILSIDEKGEIHTCYGAVTYNSDYANLGCSDLGMNLKYIFNKEHECQD